MRNRLQTQPRRSGSWIGAIVASWVAAAAGISTPLAAQPSDLSLGTLLEPHASEISELLGRTCAIDGNTAAFGLPGATLRRPDGGTGVTSVPNAGAVSVYTRSAADQPWVGVARLVPDDATLPTLFGSCVSISGDTLAVGAPLARVSGAERGAVYVFTRPNSLSTTWTLQQKIVALDGAADDEFGAAVHLRGGSIIIGAPYESTSPTSRQGAAYIFVRSGSTWTQQVKLLASDRASNDWFGTSVALGGFGTILPTTYALVGAPSDDVGAAVDAGSVYPFVRVSLIDGVVWDPFTKLTSPDAASSESFGWSLSASGSSALIGAYRDNAAGVLQSGAAHVFTTSDAESWTRQQKLVSAAPDNGDYFGVSVALSGSRAVVGSPQASVGSAGSGGRAEVFTRSGTVWSLQSTLTASDAVANAAFGQSVATGGNTTLIGAPNVSMPFASASGKGYGFELSGSTWSEAEQFAAVSPFTMTRCVAASGNYMVVAAVDGTLRPARAVVYRRVSGQWQFDGVLRVSSDDVQLDFGESAAVSNDGVIVVGAKSYRGPAGRTGAAFVFHREAGGWVQAQRLEAADPLIDGFFGEHVALQGNVIAVSQTGTGSGLPYAPGAVYLYVRGPSTTWTQARKLIAPPVSQPTIFFGRRIALSADMLVVGSLDNYGTAMSRTVIHVFQRPAIPSDPWPPLAALERPAEAIGGSWGGSVACGPNRVLVSGGTPANDGRVYVFSGSASAWSLAQTLTPIGGADPGFGDEVVDTGVQVMVLSSGDSGTGVPSSISVFSNDESGPLAAQQRLVLPQPPVSGSNFGSLSAANWPESDRAGTVWIGAPDHPTIAGRGAVLELQINQLSAGQLSLPTQPICPNDDVTFGAYSGLGDLVHTWQYRRSEAFPWFDLSNGDNFDGAYFMLNAAGAGTSQVTVHRRTVGWPLGNGGQIRCRTSLANNINGSFVFGGIGQLPVARACCESAVDPRGTYLRTEGEPTSYPPATIALAACSISPGMELRVLAPNPFDYGAGLRTSMGAVFSVNATVLPASSAARVPGAIAPPDGPMFASRPTAIGGFSTEIAQDFPAGATVTVPSGAAYVMVTPDDDYFANNSDPMMNYLARLVGCDPLPSLAASTQPVCPTASAVITCNTSSEMFVDRWLYRSTPADPFAAIVEGVNSFGGVFAFNAAGVYSAALTLDRAGAPWPASLGEFACFVQSACRNQTSAPISLHLCHADFNCAGGLSVQDIFDFLAAYFAGSASADFNASGSVTVQDIFSYLEAYFTGCA